MTARMREFDSVYNTYTRGGCGSRIYGCSAVNNRVERKNFRGESLRLEILRLYGYENAY